MSNDTEEKFENSYADFSLSRAIQQFRHLSQQDFQSNANKLLEIVEMDSERLAQALGADSVEGRKILEIGPGQNMERALYYGMKNDIVGVDLDVLPLGFDVGSYINMLRENGFGRFIKTLGRNVLIDPKQSSAWAKAIGMTEKKYPTMFYGNFCSPSISDDVEGFGTYDAVITWSVFEHLPDPKAALQNVIDALKPGGALLISLHLWTANNGHHDIRGFTGKIDQLPLWGHLREEHKDGIHPSAYCNEWRLHQWRELYDELCPGHTTFLDQYEHPEVYGPLITGDLAEELKDYSVEELTTVNIVTTWQKPQA